jgi:uncharacterized protein (TIGR04255 family)
VGEVALTVQFASDAVDLDVLASFASAVRAKLPIRQQQPTAPPMREDFGVAQPQMPFQISFEPPTALPRTWFISEDGEDLVQLQADRLSVNWRRTTESSRYPRYANLRKRLRQHLDTLRQCLDEAGRAMPPVNVVEVTYVNPIEVPATPRGGGHPQLAKVLNRVRPRPRGAFLPHAEDAQFQARWRIPGSEIGAADRPAGRLYVAAQPGLNPATAAPIYMLTVTGRVLPQEGDEDAPEAWTALDVSHTWVVLGFKDVTTKEMHNLWGLREEG